LQIVAGFNPTPRKISVAFSPELSRKLSQDADRNYRLKDLLWQGEDVELMENKVRLELEPYGAYVFEVE